MKQKKNRFIARIALIIMGYFSGVVIGWFSEVIICSIIIMLGFSGFNIYNSLGSFLGGILGVLLMLLFGTKLSQNKKFLYGFIGFFIFMMIGLIIGLGVGTSIGGNYYEEFRFCGLYGYEAVGTIGAIIGGIPGGLFGAWFGYRW